MAKKPNYIPFFFDDIEALELLGDAERGRLFTALLEYGRLGATEKISGNEKFVFPMFKGRIDRFFENYADTCEKNKRSISKRYANATSEYERIPAYTSEYERIPAYTSEYERIPSESEYKSESETESEAESEYLCDNRARGAHTKRFVAPTVEEVAEYCRERSNGIDAARFVDYYTANGWKVGRNSMKDWKSAVRTWERNGHAAKNAGDKREDSSFDSNAFFEAAVKKGMEYGDSSDL